MREMHEGGEWEIWIEADERFLPEIDTEALRAVLHLALDQIPPAPWHPLARQYREPHRLHQVGVTIGDDEMMRELNRTYRGMDEATDVLSFSGLESLPDAPQWSLPVEEPVPVGDLIIAFPYAARQAAQWGQEVNVELRLLAVHGLLHLLGYDHDDREAQAAMWALQDGILHQVGDPGLGGRPLHE